MGRAYKASIMQTEAVPNKLREMRIARGWTRAKAAEAAGMSFGQYIKLERGERRLTDVHLLAVAKAFEVPIYALLEGVDTVPMLGFGGPDLDGVVTMGDDLGRAPAPIGSSPTTAAVEIRGGVLRGMATDGWILYFEDHRQPVNETTLGELSVVCVDDGRVLIRTPRPGSTPGRFHLEGANQPTIFDASVQWAAIVTSIIPGRIAQRMLSGEGFKTRSGTFKRTTPRE